MISTCINGFYFLLKQEGYDPLAFYAECKEVLENDEVFGAKRFFVEALLATSEYDSFFMLMKSEMERFRTTGKWERLGWGKNDPIPNLYLYIIY